MTTSMPQIHLALVTPPPENISFTEIPQILRPHEEPFSMKAFQNPAFQTAQLKFQHVAQTQTNFSRRDSSTTPIPDPPTHYPQPQPQPQKSRPYSPPTTTQQEQQWQQQPETPTATPPPHTPQAQNPFANHMPNFQTGQTPMNPSVAAAAALDPKYIAMASRIAAYYQQRCHAVANYQQQKCQAWATIQRQKCQEMVQAAMLVVAWYIRDRIQRRRRREKRAFRKGLSERCSSRSKVTKGDVVRRWVLQVPESAAGVEEAVPLPGGLVDKEEVEFTMDKEAPAGDKDEKLFSVADNLIKSQLSRIEVPLMGVLSFDQSESESDSDEEEEDADAEVEADEDGEDDEDLYDDDDLSMDDYEEEELGSELVQQGTGDGSRPTPKDGSTIT